MIIIFTLTGIQYLLFIQLINSGQFTKLLEQAGNQNQLEVLKGISKLIASVSLGTFTISLIERISAIFLHITCSILVFFGINFKNKKIFF